MDIGFDLEGAIFNLHFGITANNSWYQWKEKSITVMVYIFNFCKPCPRESMVFILRFFHVHTHCMKSEEGIESPVSAGADNEVPSVSTGTESCSRAREDNAFNHSAIISVGPRFTVLNRDVCCWCLVCKLAFRTSFAHLSASSPHPQPHRT